MKVQTKQNPYKNLIAFIPIVLMLAIAPLIVRAKIVLLDENTAKFWNGNYQVDLFSYTKTRMIMFLSVWMLVNAFFFFTKKDFKKLTDNKWILYPVIVFVFSLIVSTVLSDHKNIAIWGAPERYEGMVVHLCYIIMFLYTYIALKTEDDFKYIKYSILFLATVMSFIGLMQSFGKDILTMDFMRNFIVPSEYKDMFSAVTTEGQQVYLTLQNSNYVGTYAAMIIPFLSIIIFSNYESLIVRIYTLVIVVCNFLIMAKANSRAGILSFIFTLIILFIIYIRVLYRNKLEVIKVTAFLVVLFLVANHITGTWLSYNIKLIGLETFKAFSKVEDINEELRIYGLDLDKNIAKINTNIADINLIFTKNNILLRNDVDKDININFNNQKYNIQFDNTFKDIFFNITNEKKFIYLQILNKDNLLFNFKYDKFENELELVDDKGNSYEIQEAEYIGFEGKEKLGSARGYIWSRTLPLVLKKPLFGYGADNFLLKFPQNDIIFKIYVYGSSNIITDKPHNIYLLYAINNGVIGLTSLLILFLYYQIYAFRETFCKKQYSKLDNYDVMCFVTSIGYMIAGIFNDSLPATAPIFWIILGVGCSINKLLVEQK